MNSRYISLAGLFLVFPFVGCGGSAQYAEGVSTGTLSGTVTVNGSPASEGVVINFHPEGGTGVPAAAALGSDGSYRARAKGTFDLPTGIYKVFLTPPSAPPMTDEQYMEASVAGTLDNSDDSAIPQKYRAPETSGELVEVKEGDNTFDLDMK